MTTAKIGAKGPHGSFKDALHESTHRSDLPLKAIADGLGVSRSFLTKCADETAPESLNSRHLPALATLTSNLAWLDYLEARAGRHAFTLPAAGAIASVETIATLKEFSEFLASVADGVADGTVSADDAERIQREGLQAIASIHTVIEAAKRQTAPAAPPVAPTSIDTKRFGGR